MIPTLIQTYASDIAGIHANINFSIKHITVTDGIQMSTAIITMYDFVKKPVFHISPWMLSSPWNVISMKSISYISLKYLDPRTYLHVHFFFIKHSQYICIYIFSFLVLQKMQIIAEFINIQ